MSQNISVITISRQLGSLGSQAARQAAEWAGFRLVWRDLINAAALRAGAPGAALAMIDELGLLGISLSKREVKAFRNALRQVMEELYAEGRVVILGRAGQALLRGKPGVLHVRLIAPPELRAQRVAERHQISLQSAAAQVETSDNNRRKFLRQFFDVDWDDPGLYDLVINTAQIDALQSARLILQAAALPYPPLAPPS